MRFAYSVPGLSSKEEEPDVKLAANLLAVLTLSLVSTVSWGQEKAVYHFDSGIEQATKGLRNINNHLEVDPKARLIAVTHADGVDFLMEGAKDRFGPFDARVQDLMSRGVKFQVCEITLRNRKLKKDQFILGVEFVPSGVVQITHLQQKEGYAYLKP
jgi:intracellular sulfur oxidation DsrE/DsrF family protein